jgi:hypothetical protein
VRRQRDHRAPSGGRGVQVLDALDADQLEQLPLAAPHHDRELDGVAPEHAEVPESQGVALALAMSGKHSARFTRVTWPRPNWYSSHPRPEPIAPIQRIGRKCTSQRTKTPSSEPSLRNACMARIY